MTGPGPDDRSETQVFASDEDWAALSGALGDFELTEDDGLGEELGDLLNPSDEVLRVSRRIAGQYVEVLARFSASVFGRKVSAVTTDQVLSAIDALLRLAGASNDDEQVTLLEELRRLIGPATTGRRNSRAQRTATRQLRDWLPRFATTLETDDGERLERLVTWERDAAPLLDELSEIHGIGPKRLGRLYAAGLFTVDSVAGAEADDISSVTGIPRRLAQEVVDATHTYAIEEQQRCIDGLLSQSHRLRHILHALATDGMAPAAADALREVERTLHELTHAKSPD